MEKLLSLYIYHTTFGLAITRCKIHVCRRVHKVVSNSKCSFDAKDLCSLTICLHRRVQGIVVLIIAYKCVE
ncbi:hypothetical protein PUN28_003458 [Cardiocondyla obscurior]|uniref:Secreted protein n=1 Tax=Cardiocondyla obscurior TaxID=286306 RepID=A0AAW2GKY0_9HYME